MQLPVAHGADGPTHVACKASALAAAHSMQLQTSAAASHHRRNCRDTASLSLPAWQDLVTSGKLQLQARLLITGHSLGGALAVLAAFDIKRAMGDLCVELYTFGTPYPGNRAFAAEFDELLPDTWHIIHVGVSLWCSASPAGLASAGFLHPRATAWGTSMRWDWSQGCQHDPAHE